MSVTIEGLRSVSVKQTHFLIDKSVSEILTQFLINKSVSDKGREPFLCSSRYLAKRRNIVMAKKIKYKITERKWIMVDIHTEQEEELVIELNRDINRNAKKEKRHRKRNVSVDELFDVYEYEFPSNDESALDLLIRKEKKLLIRQAVSKLPDKQKFVIIEYFWKNKSLRQIAKERNVSLTTIREAYHSAMSKLCVWLEDINY